MQRFTGCNFCRSDPAWQLRLLPLSRGAKACRGYLLNSTANRGRFEGQCREAGRDKLSNKFTTMKKYRDRFGTGFFSTLSENFISSRRAAVNKLKMDNDVKTVLVKIAIVTVLPFVLLWSIRTIFMPDIEINAKTWFAGLLLIVSIRLLFKDIDAHHRHDDEEFYEDEEEESEYQDEEEEAVSGYQTRRRDEKEKSIYYEEEEPDSGQVVPAEHLVELGEIARLKEDFITRKEFMDEILRIQTANGFVRRKELIEELSNVLISLTKKDSHLPDDH